MEAWIIVGLVALFILFRIGKTAGTRAERASEFRPSRNLEEQQADDDSIDVSFEITPPAREIERQIVEIVTSTGTPAFKYRFRANLDFSTPSDALRRHNTEDFIERPNGNRDIIEAEGGWWAPVSEWEHPEWVNRHEDERFKYIGGVQVYIEFLLSIRAVYEDLEVSPQSKRDKIRKMCEDNYNIYTVRHVFQPPWEMLIVPVLGLAEGLGPHRVGLLEGGAIRSIHDVESRSDKELLDIKGIGKAAVSALRNLAANWPYDKFTDYIERDEQYR